MCAVWRPEWTDMGTEPGKQPGLVLLAFLGFGAKAAIWGKPLVLSLPGRGLEFLNASDHL